MIDPFAVRRLLQSNPPPRYNMLIRDAQHCRKNNHEFCAMVTHQLTHRCLGVNFWPKKKRERLCQRFFQSLKHFWNAIFGIANSSIFLLSTQSWQNAFLSWGSSVLGRGKSQRGAKSASKSKNAFLSSGSSVLGRGKSQRGAKSAEYVGWCIITILFLVQNSRTSIDVCDVVRYYGCSTILCVSGELLFATGA